jgi:hypothetical protein
MNLFCMILVRIWKNHVLTWCALTPIARISCLFCEMFMLCGVGTRLAKVEGAAHKARFF